MGRCKEYDRKWREKNKKKLREYAKHYARKRRGNTIKYDVTCIPDKGLIVRSKYYDKSHNLVINLTKGSKHSKGYKTLSLGGKNIFVHRFIWEFVNGPIPAGLSIDHINRDKSDNRIDNLRLVTTAENQKNLPISQSNKSGCVGVYWNKNANKWIAQIAINKKPKYLGCFSSFTEARQARKKAEIVENYHFNHGKSV